MSVIECPRCGQRISDQATFCPQCGLRFGGVATAPGRPPEDRLTVYGESSDRIAVLQPPPGLAAPPEMLPLFPVATHKFIVLSLCSFGLYELYWAYRNWVRIRDRTGEKMLPFWRAFFAPLWGFSLFRQIRETALAGGVPVGWSAGLLGTLYLVLNMSWRLPDPWWLISYGTVLALLPVQLTAQALNAAQAASSTEPPNDRYTPVNVVVIIVGGALLLLSVIGSFLPE